MAADNARDCFVCRKHRGLELVPGGAIYLDDLIFISHSGLWRDEKEHYIGHVFIEPRRHVPGLEGLTPEEAGRIGRFSQRVAEALKQVLGVEHVYAFVIGDGVPHVHMHLIGRHPGAPREFWGPRVDEWPEAPKGSPDQIARVAAEIRDFILGQADI